MKEYSFWLPTQLFSGESCVFNNKEKINLLGRKALIVTGKTSAKLSGALDDVEKVLKSGNVEYQLFDQVEENPSLETVEKAGHVAREKKVDFVIGIGGGSPIDAAKAIAALTTNDISAKDLFTANLNRVVPIVAIPTTAGTGSEVTQYSILTDYELETKRNFSNRETFPTFAFLDAKYTASLPYEVTVNTAIDFLSHALEGYLSRRSTPISDHFALEVFNQFRESYQYLVNGNINLEVRQKLLYASMLAGVVIAQTGTSMVHALGYPLTFYAKIPHGRANGLLMVEFLRFNYEAVGNKIDVFCNALGTNNLIGFQEMLDTLLGLKESFNEDELKKFAAAAIKAASIKFTPIIPTEKDLYVVLKKSLK